VEIPYTVSARPDTGLNNGRLGIWLFLASEVMLFGALFATYVMLRVGAPDWYAMTVDDHGKQILVIPMAFANTLVLITSSVTMVMAWASLVRNRFGAFRLYMGATVLLGAVLMVIKYFEYAAFLAIYFVMTGLHAFHVLGGMALNAYFWGPGAKLWKENPRWFTNRVEHCGLFWHFVDLVWIFLFPVLYLL
jgi:heme/copper-type cytochrome/quinol oxidase subunit 3